MTTVLTVVLRDGVRGAVCAGGSRRAVGDPVELAGPERQRR